MSEAQRLSRQACLELIPSWWEVPGVSQGAAWYDAEMLELNAILLDDLDGLPVWAAKVRSAMPKWGMEMCAHRWLDGIEELITSIGQEADCTTSAGHCGDLPARVQAEMRARATGIERWLAAAPPRTDLEQVLFARLGAPDETKQQGARCLHSLIDARLWRDGPAEDDDDAVADWQTRAVNIPLLARLMTENTLLDSLDNACGFMLLQRLDWAMEMIGGDDSHAQDRIGNCNAQLHLLWAHDLDRYGVTRGYLWGLWAYLAGHDTAWLHQHKADCAPSASYAWHALSGPTEHQALRRWLAASLLKTTSIWCQRALELSSGVTVPDWAADLPGELAAELA